MDREEILEKYGIEVHEDGTVFDPVYQLDFPSMSDWAEFSVSEDNTSYNEDMYHNNSWID